MRLLLEDQSVSVEAAQTVARELYGIEARARALPGEFDANFRLDAEDGERFVLKIMAPNRPRDLVDLQVAALDHLAGHDLNTPRVFPGRDGRKIQQIDGPRRSNRWVWMLRWVPGRILADVPRHQPELLESLGRYLGRLDRALESFRHPAAQREFRWDLSRADWIAQHLDHLASRKERDLVERALELFGAAKLRSDSLARSAIHGDANDHNVLVDARADSEPKVVSVIDYGDLHRGLQVAELAVAITYAILDKAKPLPAAGRVAAGYHSARRLSEEELAVLFPLICGRLAVSVVNSARRKKAEPDNPYLVVSERPAWATLEKLLSLPPRLAHFSLRHSAGFEADPAHTAIVDWIKNRQSFAPVLGALDHTRCEAFDLSVGSRLLGADPNRRRTEVLTELLRAKLEEKSVRVGVGRYDEARLLYDAPFFGDSDNPLAERRTIHLGMDLFAEPGTPVFAPLAGTVHTVARNDRRGDYGPLVILEHQAEQDLVFYTLYGHLDGAGISPPRPPNRQGTRSRLSSSVLRPPSSVDPGFENHEQACSWRVGQHVEAGERIGAIGAPPENGDWPPHLHFQIITDLMELGADFPGVAPASQREVWKSLSPDPNLILRIPTDRFPGEDENRDATLQRRRERLGPNLRLSYRLPLKIVAGWKQYLYDETARRYLDAYNNVPHVGHSHPRVVEAVREQIALLNSNTRYLHDLPIRYADRLRQKLPEPLQVFYFVNSGSEANELALRLAWTFTGRREIIVLEDAYHGHTSGLVEISPYKFNGPGGRGCPGWVSVAPLPDRYRGRFRGVEAGAEYAGEAASLVERLEAEGRPPAAFIAETLPSVAGQFVLPAGYLRRVYQAVRKAGGVCIADEVQTGFGRLGRHFWGFEQQDAVPDILVLGKPIANGFPMGAVITTRAIAEAFDNGMEFFSTFGGNPVACAAALAVLEILEEEKLQEHALAVGDRLLEGLRNLVAKRSLAGDARGMGLFLGLELVTDSESRAPATDQTAELINRLRERGVLAGGEGRDHNVVKIRPPLPFDRENADLLLGILEEEIASLEG